MLTNEFLPRAHSKRLGELDRSNWKNLNAKRNFSRIDPAIRDLVVLLNEKGHRTFSSCSGGHRSNLRRRFDRHESGYMAFSPPSILPFALYMELREKTEDFMLEAEAVIHDGNGDRRETVYTQLDWQLVDQRKPRLNYYDNLFAEMKGMIEVLPRAPANQSDILVGLLGKKYLPFALKIVNKQMRRFKARVT